MGADRRGKYKHVICFQLIGNEKRISEAHIAQSAVAAKGMTLIVFLAPVCQLFTYVPENRKKKTSVHLNLILLSPRTHRHWTGASSKKISILQHGTHHVCVWERVIEASGGEGEQGPLRR